MGMDSISPREHALRMAELDYMTAHPEEVYPRTIKLDASKRADEDEQGGQQQAVNFGAMHAVAPKP